MTSIFLTKNSTFIIGPIAQLLGVLMNVIFEFLNKLGIPSIGLSIILFTIIIYMLMLPITIKQQKFSKMSAKMNPEIQAIQKKYKGKQDQVSMMKMNDETKAVYAKYGTSPTGTCLPLLIQMPILFALYRVIYAIPAYIDKVREAFYPLVTNIMTTSGAVDFIQNSDSARYFAKQDFTLENTIIDVLNKFSVAEWSSFGESFPELQSSITAAQTNLNHFNNFLGLNIAETPWHILMTGIQAGAILLIISALIIPVLSGFSQWLSVRLMSQPQLEAAGGDDMANSMASSMKMMNTMMPLMSVYFCFILPAGMGVYWIISAVVRTAQQLVINKQMKNMDIDEEVKKNIEKYNRKREKQGLPPQKISGVAKMNTRTVQKEDLSEEEREEKIRRSTEYYNKGAAKPGSLAAKARMVEQYNERNKK